MFLKKDDKLRQEISELRQEIDSLKEIVKISIGNNGVQTDIRQTYLRQKIDTTNNSLNNQLTTTETICKKDLTTTKEDISAIEVVNLMNDFKEALIKKFKAITDQEFFIFNLIYSLEEKLGAVSYKNISEKAGISESAVRDHVRGLIRKGIPIYKEKSNNKVNFFMIPPELRAIVSLDSLMKLRMPQRPLGDVFPVSQEIVNIIK